MREFQNGLIYPLLMLLLRLSIPFQCSSSMQYVYDEPDSFAGEMRLGRNSLVYEYDDAGTNMDSFEVQPKVQT